MKSSLQEINGMGGEAGMAYDALQSRGLLIVGGYEHHQNPAAPKAYINILVFDKNFNFVTGAYDQISGNAEQVSDPAKDPHDYLVQEVTVEEPGYAFIFLSNENLTQVDVHFDDVKVSHTHSPVVAGADYYPFGLVMETREITDEPYRWGYQGQYSAENKETGWNEFQLRFYDAKIGRWLSADPYGQYASPYMAMGNTPNMSVDPDGGWSWTTAAIGFGVGAAVGYVASDGDWRWALAGGIAGGAIGGASFTKSKYSLQYSSQVGWHTAPGKLRLTDFGKPFGRGVASHGAQTWYYLWKHESDDGDPRNLTYPGHSLVWNPKSKKIYEINHANQGADEPDGLRLWLDMNPKTYKSIHYVWSSDSDDGDYGRDDFWNYRGGRHHIELYPVLVPNPAKAVRFFESRNHMKWRYNLLLRNCKDYAVKGLRKGGANIRQNGVLPGVWRNSPHAGSWNSLDDVGMLPR